MDSRTQSFDWLAVSIVILLGMFCVVPLAAQSAAQFTDRIPLRSDAQVPIRIFSPVTAGAALPPSVVPAQREADFPSTPDALIEQMALAADVIFAGRVTEVRRPIGFAGSGQDAAEGVVEIDLQVDQSLRGPAAGSIYTLREWSGLWSGGSNRYRAGQRLLLFLYAPDAHGLSSPVHGAEGAIPLRGSGVAPGPDDSTAATAEWLVDLRWLQAQVPRRSSPMLSISSPRPKPIRGPVSERSELESDPLLVQAIREPWLRPAPASVEAQPLSQVLALCNSAMTPAAMRRRDAIR